MRETDGGSDGRALLLVRKLEAVRRLGLSAFDIGCRRTGVEQVGRLRSGYNIKMLSISSLHVPSICAKSPYIIDKILFIRLEEHI